MVWELVLGFLVLVAASYVGTTMALRGFFGRDYYDQSAALRSNGDDGGREESGVEKQSEAGTRYER